MNLDDNLQKIPPQNLEAESSVLGAILIENEAIKDVLEIVRPEDFYRHSHQKIFRAMIEITDRRQPADLITLSDFLKGKNELEAVGGSAYLAALADFVPTAANVSFYAKIVRDKSILRFMIATATEIANRGYEAPANVEEFLESAKQIISRIEYTNGAQENSPTVWDKTISAPEFCAQEDKEIEGLAKDLIFPGMITLVAAPRGLCKSLAANSVAITIARGGTFRGKSVAPMRAMLVDRDNPPLLVRKRFKGFGGAFAPNLKVLTREDAPELQDRKAWEVFPVNDYQLAVIDSIGSFTEGVTEKEGKETTRILATVLDLIQRGPAVLMLANCTKDALTVKGRGEWMDRVDIVYEARDATDFKPSGKKDWWLELPAAGEAAWGERAARRKSRTDYRLAFIPSKFRPGSWPIPFCLEIKVPENDAWTIEDVTDQVIKAGEETVQETARQKEEQEKAAVEALKAVVEERAANGDPILKTEAETYLNKEMEISQKRSRELIKANDGTLWTLQDVGGKGSGKGLFPLVVTPSNDKNAHERKSAVAHAQSGPQRSDPCNPVSNNGNSDTLFLSLGHVSTPDPTDKMMMRRSWFERSGAYNQGQKRRHHLHRRW
jgi:hypothetical protein